MSLAPRLRSWGRAAAAALLPCILALGVGAVVLVATGHAPLKIYGEMAVQALGSEARLAATLTATTPLLFTGLATALAFRAGIFNVGVEGSFHLGGLAAAWVAGASALAGWGAGAVLPALAFGLLVGAAWMALPAWLQARLGVDEVVTTLMLNFVALGIAAWLVNGPLLAPGSANSATRTIAEAARLPRLLPPSSLNAGLLIALALLALYALWDRWAVLGLETRLHGLNPRYSRAQGVNVPRLVGLCFVASGAIGGLGGAAHALGVVYKYSVGFSPGYGFTGIAVALLARGSALGILLAALLFGALASAGTTIQFFHDVPLEITGIIQGAIMIFAVADLMRWQRRRRA
ncbi:MAG: ABC transporter permease [Burkholderiales bacterium]|nr:ABC transporter permease [Burkholderiales bacterium]